MEESLEVLWDAAGGVTDPVTMHGCLSFTLEDGRTCVTTSRSPHLEHPLRRLLDRVAQATASGVA